MALHIRGHDRDPPWRGVDECLQLDADEGGHLRARHSGSGLDGTGLGRQRRQLRGLLERDAARGPFGPRVEVRRAGVGRGGLGRAILRRERRPEHRLGLGIGGLRLDGASRVPFGGLQVAGRQFGLGQLQHDDGARRRAAERVLQQPAGLVEPARAPGLPSVFDQRLQLPEADEVQAALNVRETGVEDEDPVHRHDRLGIVAQRNLRFGLAHPGGEIVLVRRNGAREPLGRVGVLPVREMREAEPGLGGIEPGRAGQHAGKLGRRPPWIARLEPLPRPFVLGLLGRPDAQARRRVRSRIRGKLR
jgi:hypothetical protein